MARRQSHPFRLRRKNQWGFTLIEVLVIVIVAGVLTAIAAPSLGSMFDSIKINQTVTDVRVSLQETQRESIRNNKPCRFKIKQHNGKTEFKGNCLRSGDPEVSDDISVASNLSQSNGNGNGHGNGNGNGNGTQFFEIEFGSNGSAEFAIQSSVQPPNLPNDPSGKIVALAPANSRAQKKCVAVSSTLGLTRIGTYQGSTNPSEMTDRGVCTALDWKQQ